MRRLAICLLLVLFLLLGVAAWVREFTFVGSHRAYVEDLLLRVLHTPVRFEALSVSLGPTTIIEASKVHVGDRGIAEIGNVHVRLEPWASLREGRPVFAVKLESPMIDLTQLPPDDDDEKEHTSSSLNPLASIPPMRISRLTIRDLRWRFRQGKDPVDVTAESVQGTLQVPLLRKAIEASLELRGGDWRRKQFGFRVDSLSAAGGADEEGVWLERGSAEGPDLNLRVDASPVRHRQNGVATFNPAMLGAFVDELALIGGTAKLEGTLSGNIIDPVVDANLTIEQGSLAQHPIGDLTTRFTRKRSRLAFEDIRLTGAPGSASGAVQLVVYKEVPIEADLRWERIDLEKLLRAIGPEIAFRNTVDGRTVMSGALDPLDLQVRGSGNAQSSDSGRGAQPASWTAALRILPDTLEAHGRLSQGGNEVSTEIAIAGSRLSGRVDATIAALDALSGLLPHPIPLLEATGRGTVQAEFGGTTEDPTVRGDAHLLEATLRGTALDELRGSLTIAAGQLTTPGIIVSAGGGRGELTGSVALTDRALNDWQLVLRDMDTDLVVGVGEKLIDADLPLEDGLLGGTVICSGAWGAARVESQVVAQSLRIYGEPFEQVSATLRAPLPTWQAEVELRHQGTQPEIVSAKATGKGADAVDLTFTSDPIRLSTIQVLDRPDIRGTVKASGHVAGPWRELGGGMELTATGLAEPERRLGDVAITATGQQGRWAVHATALDSQLRIDGTLRVVQPFAYSLSASLSDASLSPLLLGNSPTQLVVSGDLNLSGELADLYSPNGSLRIRDFRLQRDTHVLEEVEPFLFDVSRGRLTIRSLGLRFQDSRLNISGAMSTAGDMHIEARGVGDLVLLELFDLPISAVRGPFSVRASASYAPGGTWQLDGEGLVQDAVLDFGLPVAFTRTQGGFVLHDNEIRIDKLEGRAGGGQFSLAGKLDLSTGPALLWKAEEVGFAAADGLELKVTGDGKLHGSWDKPVASGSIEVKNALYDRNFDWADILPWLLKQLAGRPLPNVRSIARPLGLDLIVYSRGGVFVDNNLANIEMWLDLQILGTNVQPVISGRVGFLDGEFFLRGRKFTITGGTVDFRDYYRIDPILNLTAEGRVVSPENDYGLTMIVSGTASRPRIQFSASDPTLTQSDVFSLATFGKTSAQLQREGSGVSAADILALVPTGEVEKRVGQLVGFDRFQVEAVQSRSTGTVEPRVTIGKDLSDRLSTLAWTSFGVESRRAVQLEYRLTRRVSLLGAWESDTRSTAGAFGGDVKFRYEFRRVPFSLIDQLILPALLD